MGLLAMTMYVIAHILASVLSVFFPWVLTFVMEHSLWMSPLDLPFSLLILTLAEFC